jgi:hypothetical protein
MPQDMQMMADGINELQELIERQEKLLEQTQKQAELESLLGQIPNLPPDLDFLNRFGLEGFPPPPAPGRVRPQDADSLNTTKNKTEQEALRYILGQLMMDAAEELDEIPENMGKAEQEMRGSEKSLGENKPSKAVPHQEQAIEYLKESQQDLQQQLQQRMQQMIGIGLSGGMRFDPLGRPLGGRGPQDGPQGDQDVEIPDEAQKKRAEEIQRLLRDRSGEFDRPQDELEYFRRLLRQF